MAELVRRTFDADLVPELGAAAARGIAIGRAAIVPRIELGDGSLEGDDAARLRAAIATVRADLEALVRTLEAAEAQLFDPEIAIVAALEAPILARIRSGASAPQAIVAETTGRAA